VNVTVPFSAVGTSSPAGTDQATVVAASAGLVYSDGDGFADAMAKVATVALAVEAYPTAARTPESFVREIEAALT